MKKIVILVALVAFATSLVFVYSGTVFAAAKTKSVAVEAKKVEDKKIAEPNVMCKFKTKEEMQEFEKLYAAKQATFTRMSVLQVYFSVEQGNLQEIDNQMDKKFNFKMDPNKMYDLNRDTMEIKETGDTSQQTAQ